MTDRFPIYPGKAQDSLLQALEDQQRLSAVERFARRHQAQDLPDQAPYYQDLIPLSKPKAGEQYAFSVDLDACSGCKACVSACHSLNGLDEDETWRSVGLLQGGTTENPFHKTVTTACHHCLDPACLKGCPTQAYVKNPETGIVKHLDDQCIGCKYCTLTCPYEVPQYNARLGIVRKCDMCQSRLEVGQAPACVQACPNKAIRIQLVNQAEVAQNSETDSFLPCSPKSDLTNPTTDYKTKHSFPHNLLPADYYSVRPAHAHPPLVWMLVLTQLSVGAFFVECILSHQLPSKDFLILTPFLAALAFVFGQIALAASLFHLGRPFYAFRALVGLKTSWISREILAFFLFSAAASFYAASFWMQDAAHRLGFHLPNSLFRSPLFANLDIIVAALGIVGVGTSIMVYRATLRPAWHHWSSFFKFYLTSWILGSAFLFFVGLSLNLSYKFFTGDLLDIGLVNHLLAWFILLGSGLKLTIEATFLLHLKDRRLNPFKRSALLLTGTLKKKFAARIICGVAGGLFLPLLILSFSMPQEVLTGLSMIVFLSVFAGEWLERDLFFTSESADRMPGSFS